ncbi:MAG TPA: RdgB/HAM1 family non-canonical purine NTP pyrophosphatase [Acidimicrobiales bacterium]|jgi:XTP/dITP diphosphohydrolase|nr:RdgB/HAM1 family non-canonical purine NTP pyrophosphatase [Acidimicrobiales bacterium]
MRFVCASANLDKVAEIRAVLAPLGIELLPRPDDVPDVVEDAPTLEGNARLKAVAICDATGLPALADDTGLEVDALGGAPGVYSARYAGVGATYADNVVKLLDALSDLPEPEERLARFRTVALVRFPDGREVSAAGWVEGTITLGPRGHFGFGYDPVFEPVEGDGRTFGELTADEKNGVSHRARALRALAELLA